MLEIIEDKRNEFKESKIILKNIKDLNKIQKSIIKLIIDKPNIT